MDSSRKKTTKVISERKENRDPIGNNFVNLALNEDKTNKEAIDLDGEENAIISQVAKLGHGKNEKKQDLDKKKELPAVDPVNTLKEKNDLSPVVQPHWLKLFHEKTANKQKILDRQISEASEEVLKSSCETEHAQRIIIEKLRNIYLAAETIIINDEEEDEEDDVVEGNDEEDDDGEDDDEEDDDEEDDDDEDDDDKEGEFPEFSDEEYALIKKSIDRGHSDKILIQKFNIAIRRRDLQTLDDDQWINDEIINFYMSLLTERGDLRSSEGYPKVYAMNTFFIPRLTSSGHGGVRRWTKKVDIFTYDIIPVPVHVDDAHWCMAIIHLKNKTIKYYDSKGTPNPSVLQTLEQYLKDESVDKRKIAFDTSGFTKESVTDCPLQMDCNDCGVFSCMFAEYITRNKNITFSQQHIPYFRRKMILEIVQGKLLL